MEVLVTIILNDLYYIFFFITFFPFSFFLISPFLIALEAIAHQLW